MQLHPDSGPAEALGVLDVLGAEDVELTHLNVGRRQIAHVLFPSGGGVAGYLLTPGGIAEKATLRQSPAAGAWCPPLPQPAVPWPPLLRDPFRVP